MGAFAGIVLGYLAAIAVHLVLGFLITREGRGVLTEGSRMSRAARMQTGPGFTLARVGRVAGC